MPLLSPENPADDHDAKTTPREDDARATAVLPDEESLPEVRGHDEARLLVQSPEQLFLYWSFARDPRETLARAFAEPAAARSSLAVRLVETGSGRERLHATGAGQTIWLEARPGGSYRADVGFYSASLPFIRLLSSNVAHTPPAAVSPVIDDSPEFRAAPLDLTGLGVANEWDEAAAQARPRYHFDEDTTAAPSSYVWGLRPRS